MYMAWHMKRWICCQIFIIFGFFIFVNTAYAGCCLLPSSNNPEAFSCSITASGSSGVCTQNNGQYFEDYICNAQKNKCVCPNKLCLQVPFPGSDAVEKSDSRVIFPQYILSLYRFAIWIAITLAIFMMMAGGFQWLTAGGSPDRVGKAKGFISNAIIGLVIALFSFMVLQTINPRLVELTLPEINGPELGQFKGNSCCYNSQTHESALDAILEAGKTCKELEPLYGPGWTECSQGSACTCEVDYRPQGGTQHSFHCDNGLTGDECNSLNSEQRVYLGIGFGGVPRKCTYYPNTVCEELRLRGKIESYSPLGVLKFEGAK